MTTLHEAAQQALELLNRSREHFSVYTDGDWFQLERDCHSAITALRAALAQEQAEPEGSVCARCGALAFDPVVPQAEPAQKPVAWMSDSDVGFDRSEFGATPTVPLYTAPPRRTMVPLTAQQLDGVIERHVGGSEITDDVYASMEQFARAIEKASWEKNHGQA